MSIKSVTPSEDRSRVDAMSNMIVRKVTVDRKRTPEEAVNATGRKKYVTDSVVKAIPQGEGEEVEVFFFKFDLTECGGYIDDNDLGKEYDKLGLKPDPIAQMAVNENDPAFADEYPNGIHWKDENGKWCLATFHRWNGERSVYVRHKDFEWSDDWWFAGVRK